MKQGTQTTMAGAGEGVGGVEVVRAQNLHRVLGSGEAAVHVLRGIDLVIEQGSYVSIVGASGSGKSTLLYLLGALDRPSREDLEGNPFDPPSTVFVGGQDIRGLDETDLAWLRNERVGFVFQFHYLIKELTAQENVCLPMLKLGRLRREEAMDHAAGLLKRLGLGDKLTRRSNRLSGGEQQRVALANDPAVLLADEPTGNLDKRNTEVVADIFSELAAGGQSIVMVTHDQSVAGRAQRIITMEDGLIVEDRKLR